MANKNPVEDYIEKKAGFMTGLQAGLNSESVGRSIAGAAGAAAVAGVAMGASALHDWATKDRDFRSMLQAHPDLAEQHAEDPKVFNRMFSTLRTFNPEFSKDPTVAGSYMRRMLSDPLNAGGVAVDALQFRDKTKGPYDGMVMRGAMGSGKSKKD